MSNYTQTTSFGPKDSLTSGDPNKVIKGAQFDTEFANIAAAIATKRDNPLSNMVATSTASNYVLDATGSSTTGQSFGLRLKAGTNSSDTALFVQDQTAVKTWLSINGAGVWTAGTNAGTTDIGPYQGTVSCTFSGGLVATGTLNYVRMGGMVTLYAKADIINSTAGTGLISWSNTSSVLTPNTNQVVFCSGMSDNGVAVTGTAYLNASNTFQLALNTVSGSTLLRSGTFGASGGSRGIGTGWSVTYSVI